MFEILLSLTCIYGTEDSCIKSATAYIKQTGIEENVRRYQEKHKEVTATVSFLSLCYQQRIVIPLYKGLSYSGENGKEEIYSKLSYNYGF